MKKSSECELFNGGKKGGGKGGDFVLGCPQVDTPDQNAGKTLNFWGIAWNFKKNVIFLFGKRGVERGVFFPTIGSATDNRI